MSNIIILKFFHYLALFLVGGLGVGNSILAKNYQKAGTLPPPPVKSTIMTLAKLGLVAIIILWGTGIALTYKVYGSFDLGWAFHSKLVGASALLLVFCFLNFHLSDSARKGVPPNPKIMNAIPYITRTSLVLVLVGIAILTSSA